MVKQQYWNKDLIFFTVDKVEKTNEYKKVCLRIQIPTQQLKRSICMYKIGNKIFTPALHGPNIFPDFISCNNSCNFIWNILTTISGASEFFCPQW
jgi:hypothetical protein